MKIFVHLFRAATVLMLLSNCIDGACAAQTPTTNISWGFYTGDTGGHGVLIKGVVPDSPAAKTGLQLGDVLLSINGAAVRTVQDFRMVKNTFPLYTPLNLAIKRNGALMDREMMLTGIVRMEVKELKTEFTIPGVPPPPGTAPSVIEALDMINVLDHVIIDPKSGKIAVIGHYDKEYATGSIPYLDLLKTALVYPTPRLNIIPTPDTKKQLEDLKSEIISKLEKTPSNEIVEMILGHPGMERERTLLIKELSKAYGLSPEEYVAWFNYCRLDVLREENKGLYPPQQLIRDIQIKAFRNLGYGKIAQALELTFKNTPDAAWQALQTLGRGNDANAAGAANLDTLRGYVYIAIMEQAKLTSAETLDEVRNRFKSGNMTWQEVIKIAQNLMPYYRKDGQINLMNQALNRITLSESAKALFFPKMQPLYSCIEPIGLENDSQLTRMMFEADYALKSVNVTPELFDKIPGFRARSEYEAENRRLGGSNAKTSRIWIEPKTVTMTASPERNVISFTSAKMAVYAADANDLINLSPGNDTTADSSYTAWTARHIGSNYDKYAHIMPAFHKVRETAKIIALAKWILAEKIFMDFGEVAQEKWSMPERFPLLFIIAQAYSVSPDGNIQAANSLVAEGGVNFNPKGNWTQMTPAPVSETKVINQLALSASLGKKAVQAAGDGNLEQARYLAELSAQAMSGGLSKAGLAKLNIAVPDAKLVPASPANVQLQKALIKKTHQQIVALGQSPSSKQTAASNLAQLSSLYDQVLDKPVAASDYLLQLQTGKIPSPAKVRTAVAVRPSTDTPCNETSLGEATLSAERKEYLTKKMDEARDRLKYINEALRKLIAINIAQQVEIDKLTAEVTEQYKNAQDRAWDVAFDLLTSVSLGAFEAEQAKRVKGIEDAISGKIALKSTPLNAGDLKKVEEEIKTLQSAKFRMEEAYSSTRNLIAIYKGTTYGKDIDTWQRENQGASQRAKTSWSLLANLALEHPALGKWLGKKAFFYGEQLWQVKAMGKMAYYACGFLEDIVAQWAYWEPMTNNLQNELRYNVQGLEYLRQNAKQTSQEINCLEKLLH